MAWTQIESQESPGYREYFGFASLENMLYLFGGELPSGNDRFK